MAPHRQMRAFGGRLSVGSAPAGICDSADEQGGSQWSKCPTRHMELATVRIAMAVAPGFYGHQSHSYILYRPQGDEHR